MSELAYPLPEIGEESIAADPRTLEALVNIKAWAAGNVGTTNLTNESVTELKLSGEIQSKLTALGLRIKLYAGPATLKTGELAEQKTNGATFTLPSAATQNQVIGVFSSVTETKVTASGGALIYGDFTHDAATIVLSLYQHVVLQSNGSAWLIISGEPKRESTYTSVTYEAGVAQKISESRPGLVYVTASFVANKTATLNLLVGATTIGQAKVSKGLEEAFKQQMSGYVPANQTYTLSGGTNLESVFIYTITL